MMSDYKIYLVCYINGLPVDFLLPIYTETQFSTLKESAGTCFKIGDPQNAEIALMCHDGDGLHITRINIESACKANSNISFTVVIHENDNSAFLRAFTDDLHNAFYPIPSDFIEKARVNF